MARHKVLKNRSGTEYNVLASLGSRLLPTLWYCVQSIGRTGVVAGTCPADGLTVSLTVALLLGCQGPVGPSATQSGPMCLCARQPGAEPGRNRCKIGAGPAQARDPADHLLGYYTLGGRLAPTQGKLLVSSRQPIAWLSEGALSHALSHVLSHV